MRWGTPHFASLTCAERYYRAQGYNQDYARTALKEGTIHIGYPSIKGDERIMVDNDGRYHIEDNKQ